MDRKEIHVNDNPKQVGRVHGSFRRRRGAERARRASEARRGRWARREAELAAELKARLPDELLDELLAGARTEEEITGPGGLLSQLTSGWWSGRWRSSWPTTSATSRVRIRLAGSARPQRVDAEDV